MGKIFCLIGKSASGKSTIERILEENGHKRIISSTSRPIREGETDGVDYHYITKEEMLKLKNHNKLVECTKYNNWYYGINKDDIDLENNSYIVVIEPHGYKQIVNFYGTKNAIPIYIYTKDKERLLRSLNREENPDCCEICRRFLSDIELFQEFDEGNGAFKVRNDDITESVRKIEEFIKSVEIYENMKQIIKYRKE